MSAENTKKMHYCSAKHPRRGLFFKCVLQKIHFECNKYSQFVRLSRLNGIPNRQETTFVVSGLSVLKNLVIHHVI